MSIQGLVTTQTVITAETMTLRPIRLSDAGLIELYASDERVARMTTSIPHPIPPGSTEAFVSRSLQPTRDEDVWAMDSTAFGGSELMGLISLTWIDTEQSEIGYWVAPAFWNKNLASEAVAALVAANPLESKTIFASVFQDNPASAKVLTNNGFDYIGDAESFSVARNAQVQTWTYLRKLAD